MRAGYGRAGPVIESRPGVSFRFFCFWPWLGAPIPVPRTGEPSRAPRHRSGWPEPSDCSPPGRCVTAARQAGPAEPNAARTQPQKTTQNHAGRPPFRPSAPRGGGAHRELSRHNRNRLTVASHTRTSAPSARNAPRVPRRYQISRDSADRENHMSTRAHVLRESLISAGSGFGRRFCGTTRVLPQGPRCAIR